MIEADIDRLLLLLTRVKRPARAAYEFNCGSYTQEVLRDAIGVEQQGQKIVETLSSGSKRKRAERQRKARERASGVPEELRERSAIKRDSNMRNKQPKHEKLPDYAVRFIGYTALTISRKGDAKYASLDFVSGATLLFANEGMVLVPKRTAVSSAVADLPFCIDELKSLVKSVAPDSDDRLLELRRGEVKIHVNRVADVDRFVSQITCRYREVEPILKQAEKVGSGIKRLP
jgi:hypothetical protein